MSRERSWDQRQFAGIAVSTKQIVQSGKLIYCPIAANRIGSQLEFSHFAKRSPVHYYQVNALPGREREGSEGTDFNVTDNISVLSPMQSTAKLVLPRLAKETQTPSKPSHAVNPKAAAPKQRVHIS